MTQTSRRKTFRFNSDDTVLPVVLDLDGVDIRCRARLDGLSLMEFTEALSGVSDLEGQVQSGQVSQREAAQAGMAAANSFLTLLRAVVEPDQWDIFEKVVREKSIDLAGLAEIAGWLVEQYSDRPTPPS